MEGIEGWCTEASQSASRPWQVGSSVASDERLVPLDSPAVGCPLTRFHPAPPAGYTSLLLLFYIMYSHITAASIWPISANPPVIWNNCLVWFHTHTPLLLLYWLDHSRVDCRIDTNRKSSSHESFTWTKEELDFLFFLFRRTMELKIKHSSTIKSFAFLRLSAYQIKRPIENTFQLSNETVCNFFFNMQHISCHGSF
jgi:hypothetical protein